MNEHEKRIKRLEEMVAEIHAVIVLGKEGLPPGDAVRDRAVSEFLAGNRAMLDLYIARGGKPYPNGKPERNISAQNKGTTDGRQH
jgi:hypothetical protein